jgi:hypothetical protein
MGLKIVIPTEYQRVNKISLRAMGEGGQSKHSNDFSFKLPIELSTLYVNFGEILKISKNEKRLSGFDNSGCLSGAYCISSGNVGN